MVRPETFGPYHVDVRLFSVMCVVRQISLRRADHSSRGDLPSVVCLRVIVRLRQRGGPGPRGAVTS